MTIITVLCGGVVQIRNITQDIKNYVYGVNCSCSRERSNKGETVRLSNVTMKEHKEITGMTKYKVAQQCCYESHGKCYYNRSKTNQTN